MKHVKVKQRNPFPITIPTIVGSWKRKNQKSSKVIKKVIQERKKTPIPITQHELPKTENTPLTFHVSLPHDNTQTYPLPNNSKKISPRVVLPEPSRTHDLCEPQNPPHTHKSYYGKIVTNICSLDLHTYTHIAILFYKPLSLYNLHTNTKQLQQS